MLQLAYANSTFQYGMIFSIDGRGEVTLHFPKTLTGKTNLSKGKPVYLDFSFELDDAPGFEKFYFIASNDKIDCKKILLDASKFGKNTENVKSGNLELSNTINQSTFIVNKEEK